MKKVVLSIACIMSVAFLYDISAMRGNSVVARRANTERNQVQTNPISKIIPAAGQSDRAYIIKLALSYINSSYISRAKQKLDAIIREMQTSNGNQLTTLQMKSISNDLSKLLQTKNTVCGLINIKKENFEHPFADVNDALLAGVLYMLRYTDVNKLEETSRLSSELSASLSNRSEKLLFSQVSSALRDLANIIKSLKEQLGTFIDNTDDRVIERIDDSPQDSQENPSARTITTIPAASWSKLRNLSAASAAFLEESHQSVINLSNITDLQKLFEGMQNNLGTIDSEGKSALERTKLNKAKRTLADALRELSSATYANKIKMIDEAVSDYNEVVNTNTTLTPIEDTKELRSNVIVSIFDDIVSKLEKIQMEGNLQGAYASAVSSSLNTAKTGRTSFINSTNIGMKKTKLRAVITSFNSTIDRLKNRVSFDDEWANLLATTIQPIEDVDVHEVLSFVE